MKQGFTNSGEKDNQSNPIKRTLKYEICFSNTDTKNLYLSDVKDPEYMYHVINNHPLMVDLRQAL